MTVKELREALRGLPDDLPVFRKDSEWGPQPASPPERTKVKNNPGDSYHWEYEDWNETDEPGENQWLDCILIGGYGRP